MRLRLTSSVYQRNFLGQPSRKDKYGNVEDVIGLLPNGEIDDIWSIRSGNTVCTKPKKQNQTCEWQKPHSRKRRQAGGFIAGLFGVGQLIEDARLEKEYNNILDVS